MADRDGAELGRAATRGVGGDDEATAFPKAAVEFAARLEARHDPLRVLKVRPPSAGDDDLLPLHRDGLRGRDPAEVLRALGDRDALVAEALHELSALIELGEGDAVEPVGGECAAGGDDLPALGERHGVGGAVRVREQGRETVLAERAVELAPLGEAHDNHSRVRDARGVRRGPRDDQLAVLLDGHPVSDRVLARDLGAERDAAVVERAIGLARLREAGDAQGDVSVLGDVPGDDDLAVPLDGNGPHLEALRERRCAVLAEGAVERGRFPLGERQANRGEDDPDRDYADPPSPHRGRP